MRRQVAAAELLKNPAPGLGGGGRVSAVKTVPPPVGGWNARDPLAAMKSIDAVKLENWFPRVSDCAIRGGAENHVTGFAVRPRSLMLHSDRTGTNKMFAATDGGIYNVSSAGAVGASVLARTNGFHNWCQMATSAANWLIAPNGVDAPAYFDGTTWTAVDSLSTPALTGVASTDLIAANVYKRRLFFIEKERLNFRYLAVDSVGGALGDFPLGPLCTKGGYTMAMGTWSIDSGNGPDDYAVFVTSEGEAVIFTGTNPASASDWLLIGVFFVGRPLGRRCMAKLGGDLVLLTEYGAFPLSQALRNATIDIKTALSNKIEGAFIDAARVNFTNRGWTIAILPARGALLVNVPKIDGGASAEQFVMNTTTRSWCKFTGWNAGDLCVFNRELYYTAANKVVKAWINTFSDFGTNIVADAQTAFNNFKDPRTKEWKLFRPILRTNGSLQYSQGIAVDFETAPTLSEASYSVVSGAVWDVSLWDVGTWAAGLESIMNWETPGAKPGEYGAGLLKIATNSLEVQWAANDYIFEIGQVVG